MSIKISAWPAGIGIISSLTADYLFFYALYPFAVWKIGITRGGLLMTALSASACYAAMRIYDRSKTDWLGIKAFKDGLKDYGGHRVGRFVAGALKKGGPIAFVILSVKFNPFVTTIYLRKDAYAFGCWRDWVIFTGSVMISNVYWIVCMSIGWSALSRIWFWR